MSYWIEYQARCLVIAAGFRGVDRDRYVIAIEGGSNNMTERDARGRTRRTRAWSIGMIGTERQVLRQAVALAAHCEGHGLRLRGRSTSPEAYIRRVRHLLANPRDEAPQHLVLRASVPCDHMLAQRARLFGLSEQRTCRWGKDLSELEAVAPNGDLDWGTYFRVIEPFLEDGSVPVHQFGSVLGLPKS